VPGAALSTFREEQSTGSLGISLEAAGDWPGGMIGSCNEGRNLRSKEGDLFGGIGWHETSNKRGPRQG
jgi:hypothetical protein